jgi:N-acetylneuraminate synthase/sialic acid synthase
MAHKIRVPLYRRLQELLEATGTDLLGVRLDALHENTSFDGSFVVTFEELQAIFNGNVYFMGYLSDTAVFNHLLDSTYLAAFFEKGLRANNTTVNAAMECGCTVITNLDEHSPPAWSTWATCSTFTSAIGCPGARRASASAWRRATSPSGSTDGSSWSSSCARWRPGAGRTGLSIGRPRRRQETIVAGTMKIGTHEIGESTQCYVIAEIGHNHQGSLERARELFKEAKLAGAHAVKLQKRHNRGLYTSAAYNKPYDNENSFGATYGEHREFLEFEREEYTALQAYARELGVDFFATAFDLQSADFLQSLDVPAFKIASGDLKSTPLLQHVARMGKPMIVSTGGALLEDVQRAYDAIMPINSQLSILQCTAGYPAATEELDLRVIDTYRAKFPNAVIGFSSHDNGIVMPVAAYMLGARIVEKHFTLNRAMKAPTMPSRSSRSACARWCATSIALQGDGERREEDLREREGADHQDGQEPRGGARPAERARAHRRRHRDEVAGRRHPPYELDSVLGMVTTKALHEDDFLSHDVLAKKSPQLARS